MTLAQQQELHLDRRNINTMPHGQRYPPWFEETFGFREGSSYAKNRAHFTMRGGALHCDDSPWEDMHVGEFGTPSLGELRAMPAAEAGAGVGVDGAAGLRFRHHTNGNARTMHEDPANAGAVFMAASQFNCLEMVGPGVSPRHGVTGYATDMTQGPACALACPAATVFRNYLCEPGATSGGGGDAVGPGQGGGEVQIDCLRDVAALLGGASRGYWAMSNGYALPLQDKAGGSIEKLGAKLRADDGELAAASEAVLRVGVHWDTQVSPGRDRTQQRTHRVAQVFASALPIAYTRSTPLKDWEPFARLVLTAAFDATLCAAAVLAARRGGGAKRVRVFLTAIGGGAFGNPAAWIVEAIDAALVRHAGQPLDVALVHFGQAVPGEYAGVGERFR